MRLRSLSALGAFAVLAALVLAVSASGAGSSVAKRTYIVQMLDAPVVAYEGGVAGLKATKPAKGNKIDPNSNAVKEYLAYLAGAHDAALEKVGGGKKVYDYGITFNGLAAELTAAQAAALEKLDGVVAVTEDELRQPDTSWTPSFLGIDRPGGLWQQLGGVGKAGEDIVVGIVDTGVWPEHPSFSDRTGTGPNGQEGKLAYQQIPGWHGKCVPGEEFNASHCNQKLIGAQYFYAGFGRSEIADFDFLSPRDWNGHGSHTASTAAGNNGVQATGDAAPLGKISGMAPRARVASYKVCWERVGGGGCATSDSMAAIDQAVADGVDVINFSISGTRTNFLDPVEIAWLFAADAGVFVAASAGNTNGDSTVAHPSPWITTVAASTHNRGGSGSVTFGNGAVYNGASLAAQSVSGPFVDSEAAGLAGAAAEDVRLCVPGTLDPAKVTGKIVHCDRGVIARTDKSFAVRQAGGIGMVMTNTAPIGVNADLHYVPSIHIESTEHAAIEAYAATPGATATIAKGVVGVVPAPFMAGFSSDGPLLAGGGDLLKPDVTAPGVDVLAAVAPPGNRGRLFDLYSGTSMSSPHVAGLGAALKDLRPTWSPMAIKSALMTTGYTVTPTVRGIFEFGGGHVDPNKAADPGLVFDSGFRDWLAFLKGQKLCCASAASIPALDASDLNLASIAIGDLAGSQTVSRKAKSVGSQSETYTFSVTGLTGITVTPSATSFTVAPGAEQAFSVSFLRTAAAPVNTYQQGFVTWTGDKGHVVRMPVVIRPVSIAAPAEVSGTGGPLSWTAKAGYDGPLNASVRGLVPATTTAVTVAQDPDATFDPAVTEGTFSKTVSVPSGAFLRTGIYEDAITPAGTDLDLYVYRGTTLVGAAADGDSNEEVTLRNTTGAAAVYTIYVHGWSTNGPSASLTLFDWVLAGGLGNTTVTPASTTATIGGTVAYGATFSGLAAATRYFGAVEYDNGSAVVGRTFVSVKTP